MNVAGTDDERTRDRREDAKLGAFGSMPRYTARVCMNVARQHIDHVPLRPGCYYIYCFFFVKVNLSLFER